LIIERFIVENEKLRSEIDPEHYFINPFGLLYSEVTASSLVKIDADCNVIEGGSTTFGVNKAGFVLHSAIHTARPDINACVHVHTAEAAGLSALKCGLLPISQEATICGDVGYHDYDGILIDEKVKQRIVNDLGDKKKILILKNHGVVVCGSTLEEAVFWLETFMTAAAIQSVALSSAKSIDNLTVPSEEVIHKVKLVVQSMSGVNAKSADNIQWSLGEMDLEAEMRNLDYLVINFLRVYYFLVSFFIFNLNYMFIKGHNTGYPYKKPIDTLFKKN
jgi:adducin